jgi:hypothetical protein
VVVERQEFLPLERIKPLKPGLVYVFNPLLKKYINTAVILRKIKH